MEIGRQLTLERLETEHIRRALAASSSLGKAARVLGTDPSSLYRKRKRAGL